MKKLLITIIALAVLGSLAYAGKVYWVQRGATPPAFKTAQITKGELLATISATGTVEPEEVVDVGAQVGGLILSFGKDAKGKPIDYGSTVEEGTILATIDDSLYQSDMAQQSAAVDQAKASLARAQADLMQYKAKAQQALNDFKRAEKLKGTEAMAQVNYDAYVSACDSAKANVDVGVASIGQAQASLNSAQAGLVRSSRNLSYCVIKSPVKGVIIDRRVNIGQTVVSSLNAPSLFLIAKDLTRIQVWVAVNEADIGSIHQGQPVTFTVDALPGRTFKGSVNKVRLNATMTSNVVTYTVEVTADNVDGKLLPYLTANAQFEIARHADVLLVPNTALRWTPSPQYISPAAQAASDAKAASRAPTTRRAGSDGQTRGTLWVMAADGLLQPVKAKVGLSDGANTEVEGKDVSEQMEIVIGELRTDAAAPGSAASPFTPQMRGGRR